MRKNNIKRIWAEGGVVLNCFLSIADAYSAELMAHQGFDCLTVDLQHGLQDMGDAALQFQAISTTDTVPVARVPWLEPVSIMKTLDLGASALICPLVNNRKDAETLVQYAKYPPLGERSFGPHRQMLYAGADYPQHANDESVLIAMIETREALDNLEEIASTPGIDALYIGPADLSLNLGFPPGFEPDQPEMVAAFDAVLKAARDAGIIAGIHCGSTAFANRMIDRGFRLVTVLNDGKLMAQASQQVIQNIQRTAK
ncbi:MAG: 2,4-dihydroxyhept-2-ene-1,7-dioic acid aldolase [Oceanospirillaceae bacterium]|nr:2,4-dihydroxyhept-2-ene-1,7-dioic acid aldolase [Oceanospirillaceae bacterium]